MEEEWRNIEGYNNLYQISSMGRVRSFAKNKCTILKNRVSDRGYYYLTLNAKSHKIHRLVALAFIENPENKPQVNHINSNKLDNNVTNLEWVTQCENAAHSVCYRRKLGVYDNNWPSGAIHYNRKKVFQNDLAGNFIRSFESVSEAAKVLGICKFRISQCARGKLKKFAGFKFSYL